MIIAIYDYAFSYNTKIKRVIFPDTIVQIRDNAFYD